MENVKIADDAIMAVSLSGGEEQMPMKDYLLHVVYAEIGGSYPDEAGRAQVICARTYAKYKLAHGDVLCGDYRCCTAFAETVPEDAAARISQWIADTDGQVLTWEGEPILAVFHAASGGRTEAAEDVWGGSYPYLQSVAGVTTEPDVSEIAREEALSRLREGGFAPNERADAVGSCTRTAGGGVAEIEIFGVRLTGRQARQVFSLRSAAFDAAETGEGLRFTVHGNGHRVGFAQEDARLLAEQGADCESILMRFFPETNIKIIV